MAIGLFKNWAVLLFLLITAPTLRCPILHDVLWRLVAVVCSVMMDLFACVLRILSLFTVKMPAQCVNCRCLLDLQGRWTDVVAASSTEVLTGLRRLRHGWLILKVLKPGTKVCAGHLSSVMQTDTALPSYSYLLCICRSAECLCAAKLLAVTRAVCSTCWLPFWHLTRIIKEPSKIDIEVLLHEFIVNPWIW